MPADAVRTGTVLAIDGGNSKTEAALIGADGAVLGTARGGGSNPQVIGRDVAFAVLEDVVRAAAAQAGLPARGPVAAHTSACLAGADLPEEERQLAELVAARGWSASCAVVNDTFAVLRAGLADAGGAGDTGGPGKGGAPWGIGVTCGAGINCVGVAPDGQVTRFLALGEISGDWGGGRDLADQALWWAIRAQDGRGPDTALRSAVPAHFGLAAPSDVTLGLYQGKITAGELHGLVPVLFEVAGAGDQVARDLIIALAAEICVMARVAARNLRLTSAAVPVVLGGSLLTARHPLLEGRIREQLAADLPAAIPVVVDVPPVAGAALLGLDHVGASLAAQQRLRSCYQR